MPKKRRKKKNITMEEEEIREASYACERVHLVGTVQKQF